MSVTQLEDPAFADRLNGWPSSRGLDGLVVEVVESVFLPDNVRAMDTLMKLVQQGAEISIDDYGSGFSNLRLLKELSPSYIKMDRSLIEMDGDPTK